MNPAIKKYFLFICCAIFSIQCFSQSRSKANQPPWVIGSPSSWQVGELPHINLQGNLLKVYFSEGSTREAARTNAEKQLVQNITTQSGAVIARKDKFQDTYTESRNEKNITINGKTIARYTALDEYYEYANGMWHSAVLYLLAENDNTLAYVPPITYGIDRGAWRSIIIPGWSQLYTGRTGAGITFLVGQAGLIGGTLYINHLADYYKKRQNEAYSFNVKQDYKKRYDQTITYRNVALGASAAWYLWNVIDAFSSKRGKLYYTRAYGNSQFSVIPIATDENKLPTLGITCNFNF